MSSLIDKLQELNDKQKQAVCTTEGPLLIAAGAGSGKTRVLTHRIAYLIETKQVNPWNILAITFTNKAANEMKERVERIVGDQGQGVWVSTFHAMCARILRREHQWVGYDQNFSIIDQSEQQTLMKQVLKELDLDSQRFNPKDLLWIIDQAKNQGQSPEEFAEVAMGYIGDIQANVYRSYQAKLRESNSMDFNDLILITLQLLQNNPSVREFYQRKFQYIHVDEYQDTNHSQYLLVKILSEHFENICVVGDADQSIYGWRGANIENILNFEKDYPETQIILLEQNYRSTQRILDAANSVISHNTNRKAKNLWSDNAQGDKIKVYLAETEAEESRYVVQEIIENQQDHQLSLEQFAILYRTQAQSRNLEEALLKANIPYKVVGGLKFYARKEIQDTLAYLRLIDNPADNISLNRIINVPKRGIGAATVEKLAEFANSLNLSWSEAIDQLAHSNLSRPTQTKLMAFGDMMRHLREQADQLTLSELLEEIWEATNYVNHLKEEGTIEANNRLENLEEFASVAHQYDDLTPEDFIEADPDFVSSEAHSQTDDELTTIARLRYFLTDISLITDSQSDQSQEQVTLMTMHAAKGLEFPVVFIVGMEEGLFPLRRAMESEEELEEERRLAYVGMTRAEQRLYLTATRNRLLYGRYQQNLLSRFIDEIDPDQIERVGTSFQSVVRSQRISQGNREIYTPKVILSNQRPIQSRQNKQDAKSKNTNIDWQVGNKVVHKAWGTGTIVQVKKSGDDLQLSVAFQSQGIKELLASLAPITKVE